ncbi:helix-turn-helix domain-containing protein [Croceicoccus naphthovorans]|uniref:XRE family transcriptional regulator n=1 Tax=Croceicoccus naphthovorans TaxID=1348774 RepID=A0A0G3XH72_9SPHN|nr:XRE family transcriptional regulator [Croceicoccus naphthovorans]AKM10895.1 XRE family transcriptional regulator [Croceicoccus naphthovorans]MBB3989133.1 transcriptional regulator with XRE-family HTH domain [Croceicoccus naphthovorans]
MRKPDPEDQGAKVVSTDDHPTLGKLLRRLRDRNGWTLKQMSAETGIPVSTLSKVEHDRLTLTYDKLLQVSQKLGIRVSELFAEPEEREEERVFTARRSLGTVDRAVRVTTDNYDYHYMCPELRRKRMIPILTTIRAKTVKEFGQLVRHPGEEYVHVLEGTIVVHTEFYDPVTVHQGEGIYIDSDMGHAYVVADGCEEARVLGVCASGESDHEHSIMNAL